MKLYVYFLFLFTCLFNTTNSHQISDPYIESNIFLYQNQTRVLKLSDGSYWIVKLNHGFIFSDYETGANWWRFDKVDIRKNTDKKYPYLIENLENHEIISCKQYDPVLCHNKVVILKSEVPHIDQSTQFFINLIIPTDNQLFIQLSDSSYWEVLKIQTNEFNGLPKIDEWNRFDPVIIQKSSYSEYSYVLFNMNNQQEWLIRQIDPAIPHSKNKN